VIPLNYDENTRKLAETCIGASVNHVNTKVKYIEKVSCVPEFSIRNYRIRQRRKKYLLKQKKASAQNVLNVSNSKRVNKTEIQKQNVARKEMIEQFKAREMLRKIYKTLEQGVIPKVPYEVPDTEEVPIGFTIKQSSLILKSGQTACVDLVPIDESECDDGLYSLEGLGKKTFHRVDDYVVVKKVAECVMVTNWDPKKDWVIKKGDKLGVARKIKYQSLPTLDDIWSTEKDFIINNVNAVNSNETINKKLSEAEEPFKIHFSRFEHGLGAV